MLWILNINNYKYFLNINVIIQMHCIILIGPRVAIGLELASLYPSSYLTLIRANSWSKYDYGNMVIGPVQQ